MDWRKTVVELYILEKYRKFSRIPEDRQKKTVTNSPIFTVLSSCFSNLYSSVVLILQYVQFYEKKTGVKEGKGWLQGVREEVELYILE